MLLRSLVDLGTGSCWLGTWGPAGQLCKISVGIERLGPIGVCNSFINA